MPSPFVALLGIADIQKMRQLALREARHEYADSFRRLLIKMGSRRRGSPSRFNRDKSRVWLSLTLRLRFPVPPSISCGGRQSALWSNHKGTFPCAPGHPAECGCNVYASYQTGKPILDGHCPYAL